MQPAFDVLGDRQPQPFSAVPFQQFAQGRVITSTRESETLLAEETERRPLPRETFSKDVG